MDINNFPVKNELKHEIACCITAYMAAIGIDVSESQQQEFQDKHAEDLIDSVLDAVCAWQESDDGWKKVFDGLPNDSDKVLFYDCGYSSRNLHFGIFVKKDAFDRDDMFISSGGGHFDLNHVSYWQIAPTKIENKD